MVEVNIVEVNIRELRNHGGEIVDRVARGEDVVITRSGRAVATLSPLRRPSLPAEVLVARRRRLPFVDPDRLRRDIDDTVDPQL